jgi:hypothetical protein
VDAAVGATIAAVAKKVLAFLLGDEKGRKFLLYVVGIALFIVCVPMITLLGLFGWMAGDGGLTLDYNDILANIPTEQLAQIQTIDEVCSNIATTFADAELGEADQRKAKAIYMGHLMGAEDQEGFYADLLGCFLNTTKENDVYDLMFQTFHVIISEEDQEKYDSLYGATPVRVITGPEETRTTSQMRIASERI